MSNITNNRPPSYPGMLPTSDDRIRLVEATMGNPVMVADHVVERGGEFYLLFAGEKGMTASQVARLIDDRGENKYDLRVRLDKDFPIQSSQPTDEFIDVDVSPARSMHYLDPRAKDFLRFPTEGLNDRLAPIFGDRSDYFLVACQFKPTDYDRLFGDELRALRDPDGRSVHPLGQNKKLNFLKFDIGLYASLDQYLTKPNGDVASQTLHQGGLVVYRRPEKTKIVHATDNHWARQHDRLFIKIFKSKNGQLYVRPNPNENNLAMIERVNREFLRGNIHAVVVSGDYTNCDSIDNDEADSILETNALLFSEFLDKVLPPVFVGMGNHESLKVCPPAYVQAADYDIHWTDLEEVEYGKAYVPVIGPIIKTLVGHASDVTRLNDSLEYSDKALWADLALVNRFPSFKFDLEWHPDAVKQNPHRKKLTVVNIDTGPNDIVHHEEHDPYWPDVKQNVVTSGTPDIHLANTFDFAAHKKVQVSGPQMSDLNWLAKLRPTVVFGHSPMNDNENDLLLDPTELGQKLYPIESAGSYWDNTLGAMAHNGFTMLRNLLSNGVKYYFAGHGHQTSRLAYLADYTDEDKIELSRCGWVHGLAMMNQRGASDNEIHQLSHPNSCTNCADEVEQTFKSNGRSFRDPLFIFRLGSVGPGSPRNEHIPDAIYSVMTFNDKNDLSQMDFRYPGFQLQPSVNDPNHHLLTYHDADQPHYNDFKAEVKDVLKDPDKTISFAPYEQRLKDRLAHRAVGTLSSPELMSRFPEEDASLKPQYILAPWKKNQWHARYLTNLGTLADPTGIRQAPFFSGVKLQVDLSNDVTGKIVGTFIKGGEMTWLEGPTERFTAQAVSRDIFNFDFGAVDLIGPHFEGGFDVLNSPFFHWRAKWAELYFGSDTFHCGASVYLDNPIFNNDWYWSGGCGGKLF